MVNGQVHRPPAPAQVAAPRPRVVVALVALGSVSFSTACKKTVTPPPVSAISALPPAAQTRGRLLATVSIAPPAAILAKLDELAAKLGLPSPHPGLDAALTANRLPASFLDLLDRSRAVGIALAARSKNVAPFGAVAAFLKHPEAVSSLLAALGTVEETQKGAKRVRRGDGGTVWILADPGARAPIPVVASDSLDGIFAAGALAMEVAQSPPPADVTLTIHPDAIARAQGTDVKTALTDLRRQARQDLSTGAARTGRHSPAPGEVARLDATLEVLTELLADIARADFSLELAPAKGLRLAGRLHPRAGSQLAAGIKPPTPYALDPALLAIAGSNPTTAGVWASGASEFFLELQERTLAAQVTAGLPGAADALSRWKDMRRFVSGAVSVLLRAGDADTSTRSGGLGYDTVVPLRAGASSPAAFDALFALVNTPAFTQALVPALGQGQVPTLKARRQGGVMTAELSFPAGSTGGRGAAAVDQAAIARALFGSATLSVLATSARGRLLFSTGSTAKARLDALATAPKTGASMDPDLSAALADTKGQDAFGYLELMALVRPFLGLIAGENSAQAQMIAMVASLPAFTQLKLPLVLSYRGGAHLTADLRIPYSTMERVATFARLFGIAGPAGGKPVTPAFSP